MSYLSCNFFCLPIFIFVLVVIYLTKFIIIWIISTAKWKRWESTPPNIVVLHGFPPSKNAPNASPFVLKVLTFLRMSKIPYQIDFDWKYMQGPKSKAPWITLNGQHLGDSELIIEFLNKEFNKNLNDAFSPEEIALTTAIRVMLEEHAFWGMAMERFVFGGQNLKKIVSRGIILDTLLRFYGSYRVKQITFYQGIGRHTQSEIYNFISKDLRAVSTLLGKKKFILGDTPCQDDCSIFGHLFQFVCALPNSPYEQLINEELLNLKEYCLRMKEHFFEDWEELIAK